MFNFDKDDYSIYLTRGDSAEFEIEVPGVLPDGTKAGEVVQLKVYEKKACENVVLQKTVSIGADGKAIFALEKEETKIGEIISKPRDYWYEVVLDPFENPKTIIGYDDDGAKILRLFPEGAEFSEQPVEDESLFETIIKDAASGWMSSNLQERATKKELASARALIDMETKDRESKDVAQDAKINEANEKCESAIEELKIERARVDAIVAGRNIKGAVVHRQDLETTKDLGATGVACIYSNGISATLIIKGEITRETMPWDDIAEIPKELIPISGLECCVDTVNGVWVEIQESEDESALIAFKYTTNVGTVTRDISICMSYPLRYISIPELADMRIDANGTEHSSGGEAMRNNQKEQDEKIDQAKETTKQEVMASLKQPDWGQEDSNAIDFVKNKPFFRDVLSENGIPSVEQTVNFKTSLGTLQGVGTNNVKAGGKYVVTWNGTAYMCEAVKKSQGVHIGNLSLVDAGEDTGEPFVIEMVSTNVAFITKGTETAENVTIKVEGVDHAVYHQIDPKFIPDMYYSDGEVAEVIVPEATYAVSDNTIAFPDGFELENGKTYIVKWDGVEYKAPCKYYEGIKYWGNDGAFGDDDTGEPFVIATEDGENWLALCVRTQKEATISIMTEGGKTHKIDNKYLDLEWLPTKMERELYSGEIASGEQGVMLEKKYYEEWGEAETLIVDMCEERCEYKRATVVEDGTNAFIYGNFNIFNPNKQDTGEPLVIVLCDEFCMFMLREEQKSNLAFTISAMKENKMPPKYLPEDYKFDAVTSTTAARTLENIRDNIQSKYGANNVLGASVATSTAFVSYAGDNGYEVATSKGETFAAPLFDISRLGKITEGQHLVVKEKKAGLLVLEAADAWEIKSPSGKRFKVAVSESGALTATEIK